MKLRDYGIDQTREWFQQILQWSIGKVSLENLDIKIITANIGTSETIVGHSLGRIPTIVIPVMKYPFGVVNISFTKSPTIDTLFLSASSAGERALLLL